MQTAKRPSLNPATSVALPRLPVRWLRQASLLMVTGTLLLSGCVSNGDRPLQLTKGADPQYPQSARQQGVEGFVKLSYRVTVGGVVENVQVVESQPPGVFDAAAIAAVERWRYNAPKRNGEPVAAEVVISTLKFKLADAAAAARYKNL